ncbi:GNAT family N-acetyltransferase [Streptomyces sp. BI20]|uniref:GNAT family N-acetyltransferase n=1 Tax=Streptomyces sp. BI20 TaxID=3403460 RepID=UPI003C70A1FB
MTQPAEMLSSGPVALRRWREEDVDVLHALVVGAREHLVPWMPFAATHDRVRGEAWLAECQEEWASGDAFHFAITVDGEPAGSCSLMRRIGAGALEIGYWLHPAWTGRGLVTAAVRALVEAGRGLPGIDRVEIHHDVANTASGAVPRRLGFTEVGRRPYEGPSAPADTGTDLVWRWSFGSPAGA